MTDPIARKLYDEIVVAGRRNYAETLESATRADLRDSVLGRLLPLFERLSAEERELILDLTAQVSVDAVARLLAMLDDGDLTLEPGGLWAAFAEHADAERSS